VVGAMRLVVAVGAALGCVSPVSACECADVTFEEWLTRPGGAELVALVEVVERGEVAGATVAEARVLEVCVGETPSSRIALFERHDCDARRLAREGPHWIVAFPSERGHEVAFCAPTEVAEYCARADPQAGCASCTASSRTTGTRGTTLPLPSLALLVLLALSKRLVR